MDIAGKFIDPLRPFLMLQKRHMCCFWTMKALSIRQPWAWLILHAGKDIENRNWKPRNPALRFRGTCLIHAGIAVQPIGDELRAWVRTISGVDLPRSDELPRGSIVGQVDVIDVVRESSSPWFEGPCGLVLANPKSLPLTACRGQLGFFHPGINKGNLLVRMIVR